MTVDCRLAGILAGETARRVASKTHWRLILPTSYPSSRSDWPIHIDSRRRSNVSNAQIPLKKSLFDCGQRSVVIH
jgi:hypothetical protein